MLILSRKKNEKIIIVLPEGNITITVVEAIAAVRIGFEAPKTIPIHREEVFNDIAAEEVVKLSKRSGI